MGVRFSLPIMNSFIYNEHCSNDDWTNELPSLIGKDPYKAIMKLRKKRETTQRNVYQR